VAVPIHWGSLRLMGPNAWWKRSGHLTVPPQAFAQHARYLAPETDVRVLQPGEWTSVN
jgi:hypothetical protein